MNIDDFKKMPVMGILRGIEAKHVAPLAQTIIASGLKTIEIAMNTPDAPKLIRQMVKASGNQLTVGAGTVLTMADLNKALDAGATFVVSPTCVDDIVKYCVKNKIPVFPGALSPQEIYNAWQKGATMVKVFPAKLFGPTYIREIKAPLQDIQILACGGVRPDNIKEFFACGASAVTFGASVFKKEWLETGQFSQIEERITGLLTAIKQI